MTALFEGAGLAVVRHDVVRQAVAFSSGVSLVEAMRLSCTWRRVWEQLGDARFERVAARFYERMGGRERPIAFEPAATLVLGARRDGAASRRRSRP